MTKVLSIDMGTASISAAVAERDQRGKFFVCDVFRYPYDAENKEAGKMLLRNLNRIFFDVSRSHFGVSKVFFGFSSPLHLEKTASTEFERINPGILISEHEIRRNIEVLKNQVDGGSQAVSYDLLETKINGYFVENPLGCCGETLEIKVNFLILGTLLKNYIEDLKDKCFPASEFKFFSDSSTTKKAIFNFFSPKDEFLILDIGGEVSVLEHHTIPFGLRKIERKMPQSFLQRFSSGNLDYSHERTVNKVLNSSIDFLWGTLQEYFDTLGNFNRPNTIFLSGAGANFSQFTETVKKNLKEFYGSSVEVKTLKAEDFNKFFSKLSPLSGGGDTVLTSLITLYA